MSTPQDLVEDVSFLLGKFAFLDAQDLRALCRGLGLPVTNLGGSDMVEQVRAVVLTALNAYATRPSPEEGLVLRRFRYGFLLESGFVDRFLAGVKRAGKE